jgi:Ferredoxin subunits of nitrite reductase and ring-hydroxylating dioxygenases
MDFVKAAETSDIPVGNRKVVTIHGKEILIANVGGAYYAIGNRCTHAGADLSKGILEGKTITCPEHKAKFDVTNGKVVFRPKFWIWEMKLSDATPYEVKVHGNNIMLNL